MEVCSVPFLSPQTLPSEVAPSPPNESPISSVSTSPGAPTSCQLLSSSSALPTLSPILSTSLSSQSSSLISTTGLGSQPCSSITSVSPAHRISGSSTPLSLCALVSSTSPYPEVRSPSHHLDSSVNTSPIHLNLDPQTNVLPKSHFYDVVPVSSQSAKREEQVDYECSTHDSTSASIISPWMSPDLPDVPWWPEEESLHAGSEAPALPPRATTSRQAPERPSVSSTGYKHLFKSCIIYVIQYQSQRFKQNNLFVRVHLNQI